MSRQPFGRNLTPSLALAFPPFRRIHQLLGFNVAWTVLEAYFGQSWH